MNEFVLVRNVRTGAEKYVRPRQAVIFAKLKGWEVVEDESVAGTASVPTGSSSPPSDGLDDMDYQGLRALVAERNAEPDSRKREDLIAALRAGRYRRRDMRAEE